MAIENAYVDAEGQGLPYLAKITLPNGTTYEIKDTAARAAIEALGQIENMVFRGVLTVAEGQTVEEALATVQNPENGDVYVVGKAEYVYIASTKAWEQFGDLSNLKKLAYKDSAQGSVTVIDNVSATFTGTKATIASEGTATGDVTVATSESADGNYTPAGTVAAPIITVTPTASSIVGVKANGTVPSKDADTFSKGTLPTFKQGTFTANELPTFVEGAYTVGTAAKKEADEFNGGTQAAWSASVEDETLSFSFTANELATFTEGAFTPNVPGTKAKDTFTAGSQASLTDAVFTEGTLPEFTEGEFHPGAMPTLADAVEALTQVDAAASAPAFTGTKVAITAEFSNGKATVSGDYTPAGAVDVSTTTDTKVITVQ